MESRHSHVCLPPSRVRARLSGDGRAVRAAP
jgi:hypothetical protein